MDIKKEILKINNKAFKTLHRLWGYDFQKEYKIYKHCGSFTISSLLKKYEDIWLNLDKVVLLVVDYDSYSEKDVLRLVEIKSNKQINIDFSSYNLRQFDKKKDFNDKRRSDDCCVYVIAQRSTRLTLPRWREELSCNNRYVLADTFHNQPIRNHSVYGKIYYVDLIDRDTNKGYEYRPQTDTKDINLIVDKSGYIVDIKRNELKNKLQKLKCEQLKNEFLKVDYTDKLLEIDNIINTTKIKLLDLFVNSNFTYATLDKIRHNLLVSVMSMLRDMENFKEHIDKKSYKSIKEADTEYDYIIREYNIVIKEFERMKE